MSLDHEVSLVANADAILRLTVGSTDHIFAHAKDKGVSFIAQAAEGLKVEVTIGWAFQWGLTGPFIHNILGVDASTHTSHHSLP